MIPAIIQPDTELLARVAMALTDIPSFSPATANELTVRSLQVENLIARTTNPAIVQELEKFAYALRLAGEYSFAQSSAVIVKLGRLIEARKHSPKNSPTG